MKQSIIKIVNFYDIPMYSNENRVFAPSLVTVIDYLCSCFVRLGYKCEIVSAAETRNTDGNYAKRKTRISNNIVLTQAPTKGYSNKWFRAIGKIKSRLWLVKYLIQNSSNNEIIFWGDSPVLYEPLFLYRLFSRRKKIQVLYFATEIYQEVIKMNLYKRKMEFYLFNKADKLIVSTEFLNKKINHQNKPYVILHGTYNITEKNLSSFGDGKIHIVYAGVINKTKGSSQAVKIARYLSSNYQIHILGFGTDEQILSLKKQIEKNNSTYPCKVNYEGVKAGTDFNSFLQKCDVGLCSQNLNEAYNSSSFPSKILTYLSNGLRIVTVNLSTVRESKVGDLMYYSQSDDPKDLAETILGIDFNEKYDSRNRIVELDSDFLKRLKKILQ